MSGCACMPPSCCWRTAGPRARSSNAPPCCSATPATPRHCACLAVATAALTGTETEAPARAPAGDGLDTFDWDAAEADVEGIVEPAFVDGEAQPHHDDTEEPGIRLADVGGLEE